MTYRSLEPKDIACTVERCGIFISFNLALMKAVSYASHINLVFAGAIVVCALQTWKCQWSTSISLSSVPNVFVNTTVYVLGAWARDMFAVGVIQETREGSV